MALVKIVKKWKDIQNEQHFSYLFDDTSGRLNLLRRLLDCVEHGIALNDCEDDNNEQEGTL